ASTAYSCFGCACCSASSAGKEESSSNRDGRVPTASGRTEAYEETLVKSPLRRRPADEWPTRPFVLTCLKTPDFTSFSMIRVPGSLAAPSRLESEPAVVTGGLGGFDAVASAGLLDRRGQVIAHRALRQMQALSDVGHIGAGLAGGHPVALGSGGGAWPGPKGGGCNAHVDPLPPREPPPDRGGQLFDGAFLHQESLCAGLHGTTQVARPPERGEDDDAALRHLLAQGSSCP